jgi:MinD superfamily P-loop ATPase
MKIAITGGKGGIGKLTISTYVPYSNGRCLDLNLL